MLSDALKARIPLICVQTDDLINAEKVLQSIAPTTVVDWSLTEKKSLVTPNRVYWTTDAGEATLPNYNRLQKGLSSLVVFNPSAANPLMLDAGVMQTPEFMLEEYLKPFTKVEQRAKLLQALKGLSLKAATEVIGLTVARVGGAVPNEVRRTRTMLSGGIQGLIPMESESEEFYQWPKELLDWISVNRKYFENPDAPHKLVPRGVMLVGAPGTGKTSAARAVAYYLGIPLYRLDIAQALNRWQGESENRVIRSLQMADAESPCVLLLDEVEKIFTQSDDAGVVTRILSTLLWWLAEHRSRVLTMMTTNSQAKIPPELYRPGRLDRVVTLPRLSLKDAKQFTTEVYKDLLGVAPTLAVQNKLREAVENMGKGELAHSEVCDVVYTCIKDYDWLPENC